MNAKEDSVLVSNLAVDIQCITAETCYEGDGKIELNFNNSQMNIFVDKRFVTPLVFPGEKMHTPFCLCNDSTMVWSQELLKCITKIESQALCPSGCECLDETKPNICSNCLPDHVPRYLWQYAGCLLADDCESNGFLLTTDRSQCMCRDHLHLFRNI
jgi:hypothetical protein